LNEPHSRFELLLFGTPEVRVDGVSVQRALSHKGTLLLAFLALYCGRPVATAVIADAIFPDSQAEDTHEVIKKIVQQVRRALGAEAYRLSAPAPRMLALDLEGVVCDWGIFHAMQKENRPESLRNAITTHARPFLETEVYGWVAAEQARCLHLRQEALETLFRQALERGDLADAAHCLSAQLIFESSFVNVREALWRELYLLLLHRQEFGLLHSHYLQLTAFLKRTAGRPPEPETQALYQKIPKSVLLQILQARERKKKSALPDSARLPSFPFALLGRDAPKRELKAAFVNSRLWTVVGAGGVGKTRFTVEVGQEIAADLKAEVGFVDLVPACAQTLLQVVSAALGVRERVGVPLSLALKEYLLPKHVLLILDNCEHVVEAVAELSAELWKECPRLHLLCTSRESLRVDGEQVFPLQPLAVPTLSIPEGSAIPPSVLQACFEADAVRLFCERAAAVSPHFQFTSQNAFLILELCRLTDGLPLGIEMVASQVSTAPLERITADLADCILNLKHRKRGISSRHQTLVATLDWSYHRLSAAEQSLLRRLSVFSGGWTLEAAEGICSGETLTAREISLLLSDLASKSLLILVSSDPNRLRFSFLETVRTYAGEELRLASERERFQRRHRDYFVALAEAADERLSGKLQKEALEQLDGEYENLRRALQTSLETEIASGLRLGYALARYWEIRGAFYEGREWTAALLVQTEATHRTLLRARVLDAAGWFQNILGDLKQAGALLEESLEISVHLGEPKEASITLIKLGFVAQNRGELTKARSLFEESLALRRELGDSRLLAIALLNLAYVLVDLSEPTAAAPLFEEALTRSREVGDRRFEANCLNALGNLAFSQSDLERAYTFGDAGLMIFRELGDKYLIRYPLYNLGWAALALDDPEHSLACFQECLMLNREIKLPVHTMHCLEAIADLAAKGRQWDRAVRLWGAAGKMWSGLQSASATSAPPTEPLRVQLLHVQLVSEAAEALGPEAYERLLAEGSSLSEDEAVELALSSKAL
jgi:predicted ATPase/DNA-binding SARP family transcriptional activator